MKTRKGPKSEDIARAWHGERLKEVIPILAVGALIFLMVAAVLVFTTSGSLRIGGGQRAADEQSELLSDGDCVVAAGRPLGRIVGILEPSQANPNRRYQVALLEERRVMQLRTDEVQVVKCITLREQ